MAPSAIPFSPGERSPEMLTREGIGKVISDFRSAALRAQKAGFKVIEIHSAHGYLLHEFLSPLSNHRTDEYGGSFSNRTRLLIMVTEAVRKVWPDDFPLFVRISSTDYTDGGWSLDESIELAYLLKEAGADLVDCSSGGNIYNARIPAAPGYQVLFADTLRKTGIKTGAVGLITSAHQAEEILREGKADLVLMGRELLRNPYFSLQAAKELGEVIQWPVQYLRSK
jgi:2,4-dienoyl-CoA reductase-like NADH-dependent reductase (Old Yellow Enzyme family)